MRKKQSPYDRGKGRFHLMDVVEWRSTSVGVLHTGRVVEVIKSGLYPMCCRNEREIITKRKINRSDVDWMNLFRCGYYREHESYVIEDDSGKRWWPRVGNLRLVEKVDEHCSKG